MFLESIFNQSDGDFLCVSYFLSWVLKHFKTAETEFLSINPKARFILSLICPITLWDNIKYEINFAIFVTDDK